MLISQPQRRLIFQQIKLFQTTSYSYKTYVHFQNTNNQYLRIQQRHYGAKDFFESFREKLDENIKQTPEFGGDLKKLSDTSSTAKEAAEKVAESVQTVTKKTRKIVKPIRRVPMFRKSRKKASIALQSLGLFFIMLSGEILKRVFHLFVPIRQRLRKLKIKDAMDDVFMYRFSTVKDRFDPTIFDESLVRIDGKAVAKEELTAEMIEYKEKQWDNLRGKMNEKLTNLGEGDTRLSVLIERADWFGSSLKKMSNSRITAIVDEIRTVFPNFRFEPFRDWVRKILFVRLLRGDSGYFALLGGRVAKKFVDKALPKPWRRVRVIHIDVYEHPDSTFAFIFTLRGRAMYFGCLDETLGDSFTERKNNGYNVVKPIAFTISIAIKLNEVGCWLITDYHEIEISDAPF